MPEFSNVAVENAEPFLLPLYVAFRLSGVTAFWSMIVHQENDTHSPLRLIHCFLDGFISVLLLSYTDAQTLLTVEA